MEDILKNKDCVEREVEGGSVEDAVNKAIRLFKVPKNQLDIKVLSEEKKGLFGMQGAKPAKIRVRLLAKPSERKKA